MKPVNDYQIADRKDTATVKKSKTSILVKISAMLVTVVIIIVAVILFINYFSTSRQEEKYIEANQLIQNAEYDNARNLFLQLEDYKDSVELAKECIYLKYKDNPTFDSKDDLDGIYTEAISALENLGDYKDGKSCILELKYNWAIEKFTSHDYEEAQELLSELIKVQYKDSLDYYNKCFYPKAIKEAGNGNLAVAIQLLQRAPDFRDSSELLDLYKKMEPYQGTWQVVSEDKSKDYLRRVIFKGPWIGLDYGTHTSVSAFYARFNGDQLCTDLGDSFTFNGNKLIHKNSDKTYVYEKISSENSFPEDNPPPVEEPPKPKLPQIGMTYQEVKDCLGEPNDINTTITKYGTRQQWVYYSIYVYFQNGVVTSIH